MNDRHPYATLATLEGHDDAAMLAAIGQPSLEAMVEAIVPASIRVREPLALPPAVNEHEALARLKGIAAKNQVFTTRRTRPRSRRGGWRRC